MVASYPRTLLSACTCLQYQEIAADLVEQRAVEVFEGVAAGNAPLPELPADLTTAVPGCKRGCRRTLQYAARLGERGSSQDKVAAAARKFGRYARQLCLCFEHYAQGWVGGWAGGRNRVPVCCG